SDRRHHRELCRQGNPHRKPSRSDEGEVSAMSPPIPGQVSGRASPPPRRRILRVLLYGKNVDRSVKTRARVGLAIAAFTVIYAGIAARLVLFAAWPDGHVGRRGGSQDAVATARPDILDRNGEILATDVKVPSLFA